MRLIDADILDDDIMHLFISITGNPKQYTVVNECRSSFRRMIEEQPTVEAVPVVHGEWVLVSTNQPCDSYKCNKCGIVLPLWATDMKGMNYYRNFCPNCGADMRKKV